jgi:hypothetical protein
MNLRASWIESVTWYAFIWEAEKGLHSYNPLVLLVGRARFEFATNEPKLNWLRQGDKLLKPISLSLGAQE